MRRRNVPPTTLRDEVRRLQRTMALLICMQAAAAEGAEADMGDALTIIVGLIDESLRGLDQLELSNEAASNEGGGHGRR